MPSNWDGTIGTNWGFVGPLLGDIQFDQGQVNSTWSNWTTGWGAMINASGQYLTDETQINSMANWPYTTTGALDYWITQPGHGTMTITPIPEPNTLVLCAIALTTLAFYGRRRRCH
jgi:hypothetical protein